MSGTLGGSPTQCVDRRQVAGTSSARDRAMKSDQPTAITSCSTCPCGKAAAVRWGGRCPLVDRKRQRDETLALQGQNIETVWFVKRGTVNLWRDTTANSVGRRFEQYRWISRRLECRVFPTVLPQHFQEREDVFPYLLLRFAHVSVFALSSLNGAPEGSRTPNLQIRSLALYPVELQVREKSARTSKDSS